MANYIQYLSRPQAQGLLNHKACPKPRAFRFEVMGKPYDIEQITRAVKEASRARATR